MAQAAERYLNWFKVHRKSANATQNAVRAHILPLLGERRISELSARELREWLEALAAAPARVRTSRFADRQTVRSAPKTANEKRARRATANRILSVLKALLNRAYHDGQVTDDSAWRVVKPFSKVDEARVRFLTNAEATRLINACPSDLRPLVHAALLTGARYGELVALRMNDVFLDRAQIYVAESKSGKPRYIALNADGIALFKEATAGKQGDALIFTKADGTRWGKNHHVRALQHACTVIKIQPVIAFHELRHTYASHLAQAGVDLLTIAKLLGHADTRITAKHYAHLADKTLSDAVAKLPSFGAPAPRNVSAIR